MGAREGLPDVFAKSSEPDKPSLLWRSAKGWFRTRIARLAGRRCTDDAVARIHDELERLADLRWEISDNARRYRALLDAQADMIVRRDGDGRVTFANSAYLAAFGVTLDQIVGRRHEPTVLEADCTPSDLPTDQTAPHRLTALIETTGGRRWIEWEMTPVVDERGLSQETQATGRDVTAARETAAALRAAHDAALNASRSKSRFLATVSHEIRTPMNGILGMSGLLLNTRLDEEQLTYVRSMQHCARNMMRIIDEILDFSKIEAGKVAFTAQSFEVRAMVESSLALVRPTAIERGLKLSWDWTGDRAEWIIADEARLRQVLLNLLTNALKFTDQGGVHVEVSTAAAGDGGQVRLEIAVSDTGIGLSAEDAAALFAEFEQTDEARRRQAGGAGLGLAISRSIARAMGGDITVASQHGQGSTFTAQFLVTRSDQEKGLPGPGVDGPVGTWPIETCPSSDQTQHAPCPPRGRALLAEDNDVNALVATKLLERAGMVVIRVRNGAEAVAAARSAPFDIVFMDILMPVMDGVEATRAIRSERLGPEPATLRRLPIIAVTANAYPEDRQRYLAAGMDDYVCKPFEASDLEAMLDRWLPGRSGPQPPA